MRFYNYYIFYNNYKMNIIKKQDLEFGELNENKILIILQKFFNSDSLIKTNNFNSYDYIDKKNKIIIELKSRRVFKNQYSDSMIGLNKITVGFKHIKNGYKVYLCFLFKDHLSYYKLDEETYKKEWQREGGRNDRNCNERSLLYTYIPIKLLTDIN